MTQRRMTRIRSANLLACLASTLLVLPACPVDTGDTFTVNTESTTAGTGIDSAATDSSDETTMGVVVTTTGSPGTTSTSGAETSGDTSDSSTGGPPLSCGKPAKECAVDKREWCEDLASICVGAGLTPSMGQGTDYCKISLSQCEAGEPACQACFYVANTCKQLGGGMDACDEAFEDCLCRAAAHGLNIDA